MKQLLRTVGVGVVSAGLLWATSVGAITITGSVGGAPTGVSHVNFDNLTDGETGLLIGTGPDGSVNLQIDQNARVAVGAASGLYAPPWLSGANGVGFDSQLTAGANTTPYLTSGRTSDSGKITMSFGSAQNYFGLLWGSVDAYNTLQFYKGGTLVDTVTGANVLGSPNGDQGVNGTLYVNIITSGSYDTVVATSTEYAFEFDNVAYSSVPDGGMTIMLLGMALGGLGYARRLIA